MSEFSCKNKKIALLELSKAFWEKGSADTMEQTPTILPEIVNTLDQIAKENQKMDALISLIEEVLALYPEEYARPLYCSTSLLSIGQASRRVLH